MEIGADIPPPQELVQCILCDIPANAILLRNGDEVAIAVCQNHVRNQILLNDTLTHELIHLYDYARAYLDTNDPKQLACTEVRASALSGECCRIRERNRGVITAFNSGDKFRQCVQRKVRLSLQMHELLRGKEDAIMEQVFDRCIQDRSPFYTYNID
uniref:Mitochondrial inner membrane protease ATP23 n=1 Tax=Lygus hesperus TaxID=30085 RepID=A0A0A9WSR2_LYGHE